MKAESWCHFKMEYVKFGNTGLDVSPVCLGAMSFGDTARWPHHQWLLDEENSRTIIKRAIELGINFFDTANVYSRGASEEILGRALKDFANRDEIVIATKVYYAAADGPNNSGLSRKAIHSAVDNSLARLGTDYIDLYIAHRWDNNTPIEETMEAFHDIVKAGKVRYIGASTMYAWQFMKAQCIAEKYNWTKYISMQNHYSLLYREEEREMLPLCADQKIAVTPYAPLAKGRLARAWEGDTQRYKTDPNAKRKFDDFSKDIDMPVVERVGELAEKHGVPRAHVALAWLWQKPQVVSPVIGATKTFHIEDAVRALEFKLTDEEMAYLEELYVPHKFYGPR